MMISGRAAQTMKREESTATFVANSVVCGAASSAASNPIATAYTRRPTFPAGIVFGSVIMKKRKTRISGEKARTCQKYQSETGPRCQRAVIAWPLAASTAMLATNVTQNPIAIPSRRRRRRIASPPETMIAIASASQGVIGPHQNSSGSACSGPSSRKHSTSPKFEGLKTWPPRNWIRYFDSSETAAVPAKIHQPCMLHQSPCSVPARGG